MQLIPINDNGLNQIQNANLMPQFAMFNALHTWNILSGSGTAINLLNRPEFYNTGALRISPTPNVVVNSGGAEMQVVAPNDGNYIFSFSHRFSTPTPNDQIFKIKVFVNGSLLNNYESTSTMSVNQTPPYQRYFINLIGLSQYDVINFSFEFLAPSYGGNFKHYFAGLKFESDVMQNGLPSVFNLPVILDLENSASLTFASIANGTAQSLTINLSGAKEGDFVDLAVPFISQNNDLIYTAQVSAVNTVKVQCFNSGIMPITPSIGTFKIRICRH